MIVLSFLHTFMSGAVAQEMSVPVDTQFRLFMKILEFDKNLGGAGEEGVVIGVLYQERYRQSVGAMERLLELADRSGQERSRGLKTVWTAIRIDGRRGLESVVEGRKIDVFYVTPLRAYDIERIASFTRANKIRTITGVPEYCESGLAVSIDTKRGRPSIIVNLEAAKAEGADYSSQLLKLARIVK